jgi:hypothetical protein
LVESKKREVEGTAFESFRNEIESLKTENKFHRMTIIHLKNLFEEKKSLIRSQDK